MNYLSQSQRLPSISNLLSKIDEPCAAQTTPIKPEHSTPIHASYEDDRRWSMSSSCSGVMPSVGAPPTIVPLTSLGDHSGRHHHRYSPYPDARGRDQEPVSRRSSRESSTSSTEGGHGQVNKRAAKADRERGSRTGLSWVMTGLADVVIDVSPGTAQRLVPLKQNNVHKETGLKFKKETVLQCATEVLREQNNMCKKSSKRILELDDEVAHLRDENAHLQDENKRLRQQLIGLRPYASPRL
ncbi:hypothetical protein EJ04DRAFT_162630 [Polyplosphaeria fusca]|uniref:BZIP domain-containing protein n=1 Tax=Polyplosphaeria fusca TaxID=682080 RepID=A0A9P4R841_9PLEO|nr:hypothetical protein EJ04DRAFT_162630 [Polyplosphaeria fusca]